MLKTIVNALLNLSLSATVLFSCFGITTNAKTPTYSSGFQLLSYNVDAEYVYFESREQEYTETANGVPQYRQIEYSNSCGPTAGAIVIGFYDKYFEELIPNYMTYYSASGKYKSADSDYIPALIGDLYTRMRTNVDDVGVNEGDCLNGLKSYVESKNYSMTYSKINFGSKLNETSYINSLRDNHPVILFCEPTNVYKISTKDGYDTLAVSKINGNHIYVGYGLQKIYYTMSDGSVRTDTYLRVATGLMGYESAFLRISSTEVTVKTDWLMNAYSIMVN